MLADEEAAAPPKAKTTPKAGAKKAVKAVKPAGPGAIAAGEGLEKEPEKSSDAPAAPEEAESYAATGIDNALDLLDVVTAKMDKASVGQQAAGIERHPEVRSRWYLSHTYSFVSRAVAEVQGSFGSRSYTIRNPQIVYRRLSKLTRRTNFRISKSK